MKRARRLLAICTVTAAFAAPASAQTYTVKLLAGAPGYDHIQPFMAESLKIWDKYGLKINFLGGNTVRSNQMMSMGDFDVGYGQIASTIRYNSAGIPSLIMAPSSANCAIIISGPKVNSWAELKGKRFGITSKFDMQWMSLMKHILPRVGLSEKDIQPTLVPMPEVASGLLTGDIAAAFPYEPYGSNAIARGAKLLVGAGDLIDKSKIQSDLLRNTLVMNKKFVASYPDLAKRLVWAHLDAVHVMRTDRATGVKVIKEYNPNMDEKLITDSYDNCGWTYNEVPKVWVEQTVKWMTEDKLIQKPVKYEDVVDMSLASTYPGYPGWEKIGK